MEHLPCPVTGHKKFENALKVIQLGNSNSKNQISRVIRPASCQFDDLGMPCSPGELQRIDLREALTAFAYPDFIIRTFATHRQTFAVSEARIFQFQTTVDSGRPFVFGLLIVDGNSNLIDFCVESQAAHRRRPVLRAIIDSICTRTSVLKKFAH